MERYSHHLPIKTANDKLTHKSSQFFNLFLVLSLGLSVSSCSVVGGIFKTGVDVGIFITVAVIVLVIILILRLRRRNN